MRMTIARGKHSRKSQSRTKLGGLTVMAMVVALVVSTMAVALASGNAADRATGDVLRERDSAAPWLTDFDAHGEVEMHNGNIRDAKGSISNVRPDPAVDEYWSGNVTCAQDLGDGFFRFGGTIDADFVVPTWPAAGFDYFMVQVEDGGTPGSEGDQMWVDVTNDAGALSDFCAGVGSPGSAAWSIADGNLVVHQAE